MTHSTAALEKTLGLKGAANGGVYQFSVPRAAAISEGGMAVPPSMGGDRDQPSADRRRQGRDYWRLRIVGKRGHPILRTLRQHGSEVTALHSHLIDDSPHPVKRGS